MYNNSINKLPKFFIMSPEIIEWLSKMPKELELSGSKESYYNGEKQLKLFLRRK